MSKCVALTFDDGPTQFSPRLLDILAQKRARATFFLIGKNVVNQPAVVTRQIAEGHEVGNHTWNHPELTKLSAAEVSTELAKTNQAIREITGAPVTLMRPPYGSFNATVTQTAANQGLTVVHWSTSPEDWRPENRSAETVAKLTIERARPGSILLLHDTHSWTIDAVPTIIDSLRQQGYVFVTVSELAGPVAPGEVLPRA